MAIDPEQERHYNVRAAIPEHQDYFARWRERSAKFRAAAGGRLDLRYGPSEAETLDLFPAGDKAGPLHMFIHGGYWQALHKDDNTFVAEALVAAGISVAVVNYSLCPDVTLDDIVGQIRRAALWLHDHAKDFGCTANRLQVSGHSAGGHLVGLLMATDWPSLAPGAPADLIGGGVAISGLFDLEPLRRTTINDKVGMDAATARRLSPLYLDPVVPAPPLILTVGELESEGFHRQSDALRDAWSAKGVAVERFDLPGCHHLSAVEALADPGGELFRRTLAQARRILLG